MQKIERVCPSLALCRSPQHPSRPGRFVSSAYIPRHIRVSAGVSAWQILFFGRNRDFPWNSPVGNLADMNSGDTAWLLVSTALVLLMVPGLALFYGGLVRPKNVLSTYMHSFVAMGLITLQWVAFGYSLAFGPDHGGVIGGLSFAFLRGVGLEPRAGMTVPHLVFMAYQMMFAIITPALISGALPSD